MRRRFFDKEPTNWKSLEEMVNQAFLEMGYKSSIGEKVTGVRGDTLIDVYAIKRETPIPTIVCCECKYWNKPVPRNVVHAFRSVCGDIGAHFGLIISKRGFQSGAGPSRGLTNVHLMDFEEFQETYFRDWASGMSMMFSKMRDQILPIVRASSKIEKYGTDIVGNLDFSFLDALMKYNIPMGGKDGFSDFFLFSREFPAEIRDPRGDIRSEDRVVINSHREYVDIAKEAVAECMHRFEIPEIYFERKGTSIIPVEDAELAARMHKYGLPILD